MAEDSYQAWLKKNKLKESPDYNMQDAFLAGLQPDERGHLPDTFKKTNHITYSDESVYSKQPDAPPPGKWRDAGEGKWAFWASPTNILNAGGIEKLQKYFKDYEPDSTLILPPQPGLQDLLGKK